VNAVIKMMWLMTHINIGATLALIAWIFWPHHGSAPHNDPSTLAVPTHTHTAIKLSPVAPI